MHTAASTGTRHGTAAALAAQRARLQRGTGSAQRLHGLKPTLEDSRGSKDDSSSFRPDRDASFKESSFSNSGVTSVLDTAIEAKRRQVRSVTADTGCKRWWVIDPRASRFLGYWDSVTALALIYTAVVTPFEVAFLADFDLALFVVNRFVDLVFSVDVFLQFRLQFAEKTVNEGLRWESDPGKIARHYATGWFAIDTGSILVSVFDVLPLITPTDLSSLKGLRMMRILRLVKLTRLLRASRLFKRWETQMAINYSRLALFKSLAYVVVLSHWFACLWGMQVSVFQDSPQGTWMEFFDYCQSTLPPGQSAAGAYTASISDFNCAGPWEIYTASAYWAVMTITSIGYGDIHAADKNVSEQVVNTILMLAGGMLWGHVIGTFCGVVAQMSPDVADFNRRMDDLNRFVQLHALPMELRRRLREYLHQTKHLQVAAASRELVTLLSPSLQGEVVWLVNQGWLRKVWFFEGAEPQFLVQVALSVSPMVFTPGELATSGYLYIVHRGIALYGGRVLTSGSVWGEDCILQSTHLQRRWCARAMNYLEVYVMSRVDLMLTAEAFPETHARLRKAAIRMAVRRQFILAAKLLLQEERAQGENSFNTGRSELFKQSTFDKMLDQATSVNLSELKLQGLLTTNRLEACATRLVSQTSVHLVVDQALEEEGECAGGGEGGYGEDESGGREREASAAGALHRRDSHPAGRLRRQSGERVENVSKLLGQQAAAKGVEGAQPPSPGSPTAAAAAGSQAAMAALRHELVAKVDQTREELTAQISGVGQQVAAMAGTLAALQATSCNGSMRP